MPDDNSSGTDDEPEENEVLRETRLAKEARARAAQAKDERKIGWKTAAAAGLGSAAIIAALMYARRDKDAGEKDS